MSQAYQNMCAGMYKVGDWYSRPWTPPNAAEL